MIDENLTFRSVFRETSQMCCVECGSHVEEVAESSGRGPVPAVHHGYGRDRLWVGEFDIPKLRQSECTQAGWHDGDSGIGRRKPEQRGELHRFLCGFETESGVVAQCCDVIVKPRDLAPRKRQEGLLGEFR